MSSLRPQRSEREYVHMDILDMSRYVIFLQYVHAGGVSQALQYFLLDIFGCVGHNAHNFGSVQRAVWKTQFAPSFVGGQPGFVRFPRRRANVRADRTNEVMLEKRIFKW